MAVFFVFIIALGYLFSYVLDTPVILYASVLFSIVMNFISYWYSDKIALAMSGAKPITREQDVRLYRIVENLSITAGLPMPRLYWIPSEQINAFATGRNAEHAAVAVTKGSLDKLDDNELQGVLAHELSHVGNRDILVSTVAVVLSGLIAVMADWFLRITYWGGRRGGDDDRKGNQVALLLGVIAAILAPIAATLIKLAVSRKREFLADASGALLTRYPEGLASALEKISMDQTPMPAAKSATAHLFLSNPFKGREKTSWFTKLFMTHPPLEERIRILRGMEVSQ
ncbi:MAG: M48 family metallopeptidase [Candidatus Yanofskybacteria bacterium]|nr:M48 family metallopeptidase [Candidatus Yanofskybacteria bacterium]